jgi:hypothetical protein
MPNGGSPDDALCSALEALAVEHASSCLLDASARFVAVNLAWDRFALLNGGGATCRGESLLGSAYPAHVEGEAPRARVEQELARSLAGESFSVDSECSSPEVLRLLRTQHVPVRRDDDAVVGVLLVHTVVQEGPMRSARPLAPPDEALYRRADGLVLVCSCCRRVHRVGSVGRWDFVTAYVERPPVPVSHGFCEPCLLQFGAGSARRR